MQSTFHIFPSSSFREPTHFPRTHFSMESNNTTGDQWEMETLCCYWHPVLVLIPFPQNSCWTHVLLNRNGLLLQDRGWSQGWQIWDPHIERLHIFQKVGWYWRAMVEGSWWWMVGDRPGSMQNLLAIPAVYCCWPEKITSLATWDPMH